MDRTFLSRVVLAVALALCAVAPRAHAQTMTERVDMLVGDAYAAYDELLLPDAEALLIEALELAANNGIRSPGTAAAYIMLGVVWAAQTGDPQVARQPFSDGLSIDPIAEIHPYYATPTLVGILEELRAALPPAVAEAPPIEFEEAWEEEPVVEEPVVEAPPTPPTPPRLPAGPPATAPPTPRRDAGPALTHTAVTEAPAGRPVSITAQATDGAGVARVTVNFRPFGNPNYFAQDLTPGAGGVFRGEIPASSLRNTVSIDYFLVAYDRAGTSVGAVGSSTQPVTLFFSGVDATSSRGRSSDRSRERAREARDGEIAHFSLHGGTGLGLATAEPNVYADEIQLNPGLAPTPFHIGLEGGFAPGRGSLHIVPFLRMQMVFLDSGIEPLALFGVKARYFFKDDGDFRLYGQGGLGFGEVSHLVRLDQIEAGTFDTTNEGPFHVGAGLGAAYMLSDNFGIQLDTYLMLLVNRVSVQLDVAAGPYIRF